MSLALPGPHDYIYAGAAAIGEHIDRIVMAILRDGRHLVGKLISYDQFGSLVLMDGKERSFAPGLYSDIELGSITLIRGENVVLLAELDASSVASLRRVSQEELRATVKALCESNPPEYAKYLRNDANVWSMWD